MSRTKRKLKSPTLKPKEGTYWCRRCGAEGRGEAKYTETTYGVVNISAIMEDEIEYGDDWETVDSDNHETYAYECGNCCLRKDEAKDVFTTVMSAPLMARIAMLRIVEVQNSALDWTERRQIWSDLKPITPEQEKGKEVEYDDPQTD